MVNLLNFILIRYLLCLSYNDLPKVSLSGCEVRLALVAAASGVNKMGRGPVQEPSEARVLAAIHELSSTDLVESVHSLASFLNTRAVAGRASRASLNP